MWKERSGPPSREEQAFVLSPTLLGVKVVAGGSSSGGEQPRRVLHSPLSLLVEALARCGPGVGTRAPSASGSLRVQHGCYGSTIETSAVAVQLTCHFGLPL